MMNRGYIKALFLICFLAVFTGCQTTRSGKYSSADFPTASAEAQWIRDGQPIEFEGESWYPADGIESLMDSEVYLLGTYHDVQFFAEKVDIRPYSRLYTKFSRNKFRYFQKRPNL